MFSSKFSYLASTVQPLYNQPDSDNIYFTECDIKHQRVRIISINLTLFDK